MVNALFWAEMDTAFHNKRYQVSELSKKSLITVGEHERGGAGLILKESDTWHTTFKFHSFIYLITRIACCLPETIEDIIDEQPISVTNNFLSKKTS